MAEGKQKQDGLLRALKAVLGCVDYTKGNCRSIDMIGPILPKAVIATAREEIAKAEAGAQAVKGEPEYVDVDDVTGNFEQVDI